MSSQNTTINTYLMKGTGSGSDITYTTLCDITSYPDMITPPETIDISTMSSQFKKYAAGMIDVGQLEFEAIYDKDKFNEIDNMEGSKPFALYFGENGESGKFTWTGEVAASVSGAGVGEARKMKITFYPDSDITLA